MVIIRDSVELLSLSKDMIYKINLTKITLLNNNVYQIDLGHEQQYDCVFLYSFVLFGIIDTMVY